MKPSIKPHLKLIERGTQLERRAWQYHEPDPDYDFMAVHRLLKNQERELEEHSVPRFPDVALMLLIVLGGIVIWTAFILWAVN